LRLRHSDVKIVGDCEHRKIYGVRRRGKVEYLCMHMECKRIRKGCGAADAACPTTLWLVNPRVYCRLVNAFATCVPLPLLLTKGG
jgi:hypothetical protein